MLVTLSGMVTLVKLAQSRNASPSIIVTALPLYSLGIITSAGMLFTSFALMLYVPSESSVNVKYSFGVTLVPHMAHTPF